MLPVRSTNKFTVFELPNQLLLTENGERKNDDDIKLVEITDPWLVDYRKSIPLKEEIFQRIYHDCPTSVAAYASLQQRQAKPVPNEDGTVPILSRFVKSTLTYGEVTSMEVINSIVEVLIDDDLIFTPSSIRTYKKKMPFYDLGSGCGKVVLGACLTGLFSLCCGIELLTSIHDMAVISKDRYEVERAYYKSCRIMDDDKQSINELFQWDNTDVEFYAGDFTQIKTNSQDSSDEVSTSMRDWRRGKDGEFEPVLIFMNSTCFDDVLMNCIEDMISEDKIAKDSIVVTLSQPFLKKRSKLQFVREIRKEMSWGMADIFVHKKV